MYWTLLKTFFFSCGAQYCYSELLSIFYIMYCLLDDNYFKDYTT